VSDDCTPSPPVLLASSLAATVDVYWMVLLYIQNAIEDIEGADGRLEYLHGLKYRLVEALQGLDGALWPQDRAVEPAYRAPYALEHGIRFLDLDGEQLRARIVGRGSTDFGQLQAALLSLAQTAIDRLPGKVPEAQGATGQRQIIRAMRDWSAAAAITGDDLGFLAERFEEL
jgi:hypothetical protein